MAGDLAADVNRPFADRLVKGQRTFDRSGRGSLAADHFNQRNEMRRIERMTDHAALGMTATRLQPADQQPRGTRSDDHFGRQDRIDPGEERLLDRLALGAILLNEIGLGHRHFRFGAEDQQIVRRGSGRCPELPQHRPGGIDEQPQLPLRLRRRVARADPQSARQKERGPARADRAGSDHRDVADLALLHVALPRPGRAAASTSVPRLC